MTDKGASPAGTTTGKYDQINMEKSAVKIILGIITFCIGWLSAKSGGDNRIYSSLDLDPEFLLVLGTCLQIIGVIIFLVGIYIAARNVDDSARILRSYEAATKKDSAGKEDSK